MKEHPLGNPIASENSELVAPERQVDFRTAPASAGSSSKVRIATLLVLLLAPHSLRADPPSLEVISLPSDFYHCYLSRDGVAICGSYSTPSYSAFRWRHGHGLELIGDLPGGPEASFGIAISDSGSVIFGAGNVARDPQSNNVDALLYEGFVWNEGTGFLAVPDYNEGVSRTPPITDLSSDGSTVVYYDPTQTPPTGVVLRTSDLAATLLPTASPDQRAIPRAISADGHAVVGVSQTAARWDDGVLSLLETPSTTPGVAVDTSGDGTISVGVLVSNGHFSPCLWNGTKLETRLFTSGFAGNASVVSADGEFVFGDGLDGKSGYLPGEIGGSPTYSTQVAWRRSGAVMLLDELLFANGFQQIALSYGVLSVRSFAASDSALYFLGRHYLSQDPPYPVDLLLYSIPRPEPPKTIAPSDLGTLFQSAKAFHPTVKFSETFAESLVREKGAPLLARRSKGAWSASLVVSTAGVDISAFTAATTLRAALGDFDFSATIGADPKWKVGKHSVTLPI